MALSVLCKISDLYLIGTNINNIIGNIISILVIYKILYFIIGIFFTRKFKKAKKMHKYGICIAARNEEKVIGNLLDSIYKQNYPKDKYQVFVVADNCTDKTAKVAKSKGAIVYERFNNKEKTKGYALKYLFNKIEDDYKTDSFEGYFIFDADNLLKEDYLSKMNDAFDEGCKIITSYRNTKNFDENWISSTYAIHWIRSIRIHHRARSVLRLATNIQGTGFLFSNEIVKNGWKYTSLTEDRALTADAVAQGYQITYQNEAEFYDEQPTNLKVALRQRLRWARGHLEAFIESGPYLFLNIFLGKGYIKTNWGKKDNEKKLSKRIIESIRHRIASYDTLIQLTPLPVINLFRWLIFSVILYSFYTYQYGINGINTFVGKNFLSNLIANITNINVNIGPGFKALFIGLLLTILFKLIIRIGEYLSNILMAIYIFIIERKRIKKMPFKKKVLFTLTWPTFDIIEIYAKYIAVFKKVEWIPTPHDSKITIDNIK